jgi:phage/plasmid-like protein (TIGR03299 family)
MAHELNYNITRRTHSFVTNTERAWHGLGTIVDHAMTAEEVITLANLDYEVGKAPLFAEINGVNNQPIYQPYEKRLATYRTDNNAVLGLVGGRYEIVQNKDSFGFFNSIIDEGEAIFETAGVLGKGERVFVTAKLPDDMLVGGEKCEKYIILTNSHDGSSSIVAGFTTIRVVCNNTLQAALSNISNKVSIQHRTGAKERLAEAYKVMKIASSYMSEVEVLFNKMADTKIDDGMLKTFITDVMRPNYIGYDADKKESTRFKNQVDDIYKFAITHPTQTTDAAGGTVWGAYNSISGYYNYIKAYKTQEQKFNSQLFGDGNTIINKAFDKALLLV